MGRRHWTLGGGSPGPLSPASLDWLYHLCLSPVFVSVACLVACKSEELVLFQCPNLCLADISARNALCDTCQAWTRPSDSPGRTALALGHRRNVANFAARFLSAARRRSPWT